MKYDIANISRMETEIMVLISKGRKDLSAPALDIKKHSRSGGWAQGIGFGFLLFGVFLVLMLANYKGSYIALGGSFIFLGGTLLKHLSFMKLEALHKSLFPEDPLHS